MERRLFVESYLKEAYNLGANTLAEKSKENIDKEIKSESQDNHNHALVFGMSTSKSIIDSTLKELVK